MFYLETKDREELGSRNTLDKIKKLTREKFNGEIWFNGKIDLGATEINIYDENENLIGYITWNKDEED